MLSILVLHGPNLNLLGTREPHLYGSQTLEDINAMLHREAQSLGITAATLQSNHEGILIDAIHQARGVHHGLVINPGGLTHTSVCLRDAIAAVGIPTLEVHLSNIHKREEFRHHSYIAPVAIAQIAGLGADSYRWGLQAIVHYLRQNEKSSLL
jgi:3-dehydroquinate dehydratase-2